MIRVLIVGAGDVARRLHPVLAGHCRLYALFRDPRSPKADWWRQRGVRVVRGDLDHRDALDRIGGLAQWIVHLAPPPATGRSDVRTQNLLAALVRGGRLPQRFIYISTTGVYGDLGGGWADETAPRDANTDRARRRADAESRLRRFARCTGCRVSILRVPGIYAADRLPEERLRSRSPALCEADDVFTNHIHADDLARAIGDALRRGVSNRAYNIVDDSAMKMGDYFDAVADALRLPRPERLSAAEVKKAVSPVMWSYLSESRRLANHRMKRELRVRLRYPTVSDTLRGLATD